jgi:hypothetical protein
LCVPDVTNNRPLGYPRPAFVPFTPTAEDAGPSALPRSLFAVCFITLDLCD